MKLANSILNNKVAVGALVLTAIYVFVIRPMLNGNKNDNYREYLKRVQPNKDLTTIDNSEAQRIADALYNEMNGVNWIADRQFWLDILRQVQTVDDAKAVISAFGIRDGEPLIKWIKDEGSLRFLGEKDVIYRKFDV